jgi:hypothetical protein
MWYLPMGGYLRAVKIVFGIIVAISVLAVFSGLMEVLLLNRILAGEEVADSQLNINDARQAIVGLLQFLTLVAGAITFILWLYRAYQNTDAVAPGARRFGKGWAIGGWFVPFMNLWRPKQVVNDVARAGTGHFEAGGLVNAWWALWLLSNFVSNGVGRMLRRSDSADEIRDASIAFMVSDALTVAAAALAIMVAVRLTRKLDECARTGPPQPRRPRFERDEEAFAMPAPGSVPVPPKFGSGESYR